MYVNIILMKIQLYNKKSKKIMYNVILNGLFYNKQL